MPKVGVDALSWDYAVSQFISYVPTCIADNVPISEVEDISSSNLQGVNSRKVTSQVNVNLESTYTQVRKKSRWCVSLLFDAPQYTVSHILPVVVAQRSTVQLQVGWRWCIQWPPHDPHSLLSYTWAPEVQLHVDGRNYTYLSIVADICCDTHQAVILLWCTILVIGLTLYLLRVMMLISEC